MKTRKKLVEDLDLSKEEFIIYTRSFPLDTIRELRKVIFLDESYDKSGIGKQMCLYYLKKIYRLKNGTDYSRN